MGVKNVKITIIEKVLNLMAPDYCYNCSKIGKILCECCLDNIITHPLLVCFVCLEPCSSGICAQHLSPISASWIVDWRVGALKNILNSYKFENVRHAYPMLSYLLHYRLPVLPQNTIIVPIPTKPAHVRRRGFDHTLLLAKGLSGLRGLEIMRDAKTVSTKSQHKLSKKDRSSQSKESFVVANKLDTSRPHLILDDIVTTGSTINAFADELSKKGVKDIWSTAIALQPID